MPALLKGQPGKEVLGVSIKQTSLPALQRRSGLVSSRVKFLPGLVFQSLYGCGHTLKFLSATQVLSKASQPEARSFPVTLELQGIITLVGQTVSCDRAQVIPASQV